VKLYYHHVGVEGAEVDFPKTVFTERSLHLVQDSLPDDLPEKMEILLRLAEVFPYKMFNCWGVPQGAKPVIRNLRPGDAVLLVRGIGETGTIPALGIVQAYWPIRLPNLSKKLWGSERYPFIFFFATVPLALTWQEFIGHMGYADNYDPRGRFLTVSNATLAKWGGAPPYIDHIIGLYNTETPHEYSLSIRQDPSVSDIHEAFKVERAYEGVLSTSFMDYPSLKDGAARVTAKRTSILRSTAFRVGVRKLYRYSCAICNLSAWSPNSKPEVQGAHIFPKSLNGSDDLRNGLCLCRMHHWALDVGWISFSDDREVLVRSDIPSYQDYDFIKEHEGKPLQKPSIGHLAPHPIYLKAHREQYGFE
jgi:hypothetical protein